MKYHVLIVMDVSIKGYVIIQLKKLVKEMAARFVDINIACKIKYFTISPNLAMITLLTI